MFRSCGQPWSKTKEEPKMGQIIRLFMFIANNSIFKSIMQYFFSQINSDEGVLPNDEC